MLKNLFFALSITIFCGFCMSLDAAYCHLKRDDKQYDLDVSAVLIRPAKVEDAAQILPLMIQLVGNSQTFMLPL